MPAKPDNPRGFVEHLPAVRVNDRLLRRLGGSWKRPPAQPPGWEHDAALDDLRAEADEVARALTARDVGPVLVKDPRFSLTLPFWQTVVDVPGVLLVLRPPRPVVASLLRREDGLDAAAAAALWTHYLVAALRHDTAIELVVPGALLASGEPGLRDLADRLGHRVGDDEVAAAMRQVDDDLWGRSTRSVAAPTGDEVPELRLAALLHEAVTGEDGAAWRSGLGTLTPVTELTALLQREHAATAEARAVADQLRQRLDDLREQRDGSLATANRLRAERDRATRMLAALRDEHDGADT
jgi:hypothetical protein